MSTPIKEIRDAEIFLALKNICAYIVNEAWKTSGDVDFDYAVAKTKTYSEDVQKLAELDGGLGWGDTKAEVSPGTWVTRHEGDFNPWYTGQLTLEELLGSLEALAEELYSISPHFMPETEFSHYYDFLQSKLPKPKWAESAIISIHNLHPTIQEHCTERFNDGHYSDAILAAYKVVFNEIKGITNIHHLDGKQLIEKAFSLSSPIIKLNSLKTQSDKDEQLGFMLLFSGAAVGIRNPKAHDLVVQEDKQKALLYLSFASLLMQRLDERKVP